MNQQKHTPGPWELHTSNSTGNVWIEDAESNCVIAPSYAFGINGIKDKQSMANARLIAAAPDLLNTLETTVQNLAFMVGAFGYKLNESDKIAVENAIASARREINKASGE